MRPCSPIRDSNPDTSWVHRPGFRLLYVFLTIATWFFLRMTFFNTAAACWTVVLHIHTVLTFVLLHWIKGVPESFATSPSIDHERMTFWEQIDDGYFGTPTRRFLTAAPIVIFLASIWLGTIDDFNTMMISFISTVFVLVPKSEAMFGVRVFGWNA